MSDELPTLARDSSVSRTGGLIRQHAREFGRNRFVYPVLSRRSRGLSVGVNLNPDKVCNFDCIYCQVDRTSTSETQFVEMPALLDELDQMLDVVTSGELFEEPPFSDVPQDLRRLNDIAFSGDGEPTTYRNFDEIVAQCAGVKRARGLDSVKLVLITNASMFQRAHVRRGLEVLDANQGEIWAKLDAGTEGYFQLVDRTSISFQQILANITHAARKWPLVIQALFMRIHGQSPPPEEIAAFCERLGEIVAQGGVIKLVQVYTIARPPTESFVTPLTDQEVNAIVDQVRTRTGLTAEPFYGSP
jgi:wyosine [tRNA(Phe)-imidazoG37] synthetase (radical SAM superfamily)